LKQLTIVLTVVLTTRRLLSPESGIIVVLFCKRKIIDRVYIISVCSIVLTLSLLNSSMYII